MLNLNRLYALNRAVTAFLGHHQTLNIAVNLPYSNGAIFRDRAVKISVNCTALYSPPL